MLHMLAQSDPAGVRAYRNAELRSHQDDCQHLIDPAQSQPTNHPRIFCYEEPLPDAETLQKEISLLTEAITKRDLSSALYSMEMLVPEYNSNNGQ